MSLTTSIAPSDDTSTSLALGGELDVAGVEAVRGLLRLALAEHPTDIDLDLSGVTFIDCAGLAVLLWCHEEARYAGRPMLTAELSGPVARLVRATGTGHRFAAVQPPAA